MLTNNMYAVNQYIISKLHKTYRTIISYYKKNDLSILNKSFGSYTKSISLINI